jgi:hypothetical protein
MIFSDNPPIVSTPSDSGMTSSSSHSSSHHKPRHHAKVKLDMPVYNPTPISELKRINSPSGELGDVENL